MSGRGRGDRMRRIVTKHASLRLVSPRLEKVRLAGAPTSHSRPKLAANSGQPFSRAQSSTFSLLKLLDEHRARVPRAAVRARPLQHLEVAVVRLRPNDSAPRRSRAPTSAHRGGRPSPRTCTLVPRAVVRARPLQRLEVAAPRRERARVLVPRAAVLARPLQHIEVAARRRIRARPPRPTGIRSRAPTSAPRGGRPSPRAHVRLFHGQPFSRAHFSSRGGRDPPRCTSSPRPTGSRSRAPTSAHRGGRPTPHPRSSSHGQPFSRAHFSNRGGRPPPPHMHVCSSHGQSFSRAHFSTSRRRQSPRSCTSPSSTGHLRVRPLQHLEVAGTTPRSRTSTRSTGSGSRAPT